MKKLFFLAALATATTGAFAAPSTSSQAIDEARPLFQKGDYAGAQKLTEQALALAKTPEEKVKALLDLGLTYRGRKLYPQAREQWRQILELPGASAKDKAGTHSLLGASYSEEENWVYARTEFQKAVDEPELSAQEKAGNRLFIAVTFAGEKNTVEAEKRFLALAEDATVDANFRALAYSQLGQVQAEEHEFEQARAAFNQILSFPNAPRELRVVAQAGIAQSFKDQGDPAKAQAEFVKAQAEALKQSVFLAQAKQFAPARAMMEQALTFGTINPVLEAALQGQISDLLVQEGKPDEARTRLETLVKKQHGPGLSAQDEATLRVIRQNALLQIAKLHAQQGNKEGARQLLQDLLKTDDLNPGVKVAADKALQELA